MTNTLIIRLFPTNFGSLSAQHIDAYATITPKGKDKNEKH